jgi:hydroxymethylpyrimidine/phosphomethylpyrimidine kinase
MEGAVVLAKKFITQAIQGAFAIGAGHSPVHHFHAWWKRSK